jgi:glycogen operon protein
LTRFYHDHPVLRRRKFFQGTPVLDSRIKDLTWFHPDGEEISDEQWQSETFYAFGFLLAGDAIDERDARGNRIVDDTLLILFNASPKACTFTLPDEPGPHLDEGEAHGWERILDTRDALPHRRRMRLAAKTPYTLEPRTLALFCWPREVRQRERKQKAHTEAQRHREEEKVYAALSQPAPAIGGDL